MNENKLTMYVHACFCGHMGGYVAVGNESELLTSCLSCDAKRISQAFVSIGSIIRRAPHADGHSFSFTVTYMRPTISNAHSTDYHVEARCNTCQSPYTVGPNDTSPSWYNWTAHNKMNLPIPPYKKRA